MILSHMVDLQCKDSGFCNTSEDKREEFRGQSKKAGGVRGGLPQRNVGAAVRAVRPRWQNCLRRGWDYLRV